MSESLPLSSRPLFSCHDAANARSERGEAEGDEGENDDEEDEEEEEEDDEDAGLVAATAACEEVVGEEEGEKVGSIEGLFTVRSIPTSM